MSNFKWAKATADRAWRNRSVQSGYSDDGRPKYRAVGPDVDDPTASLPKFSDGKMRRFICDHNPNHRVVSPMNLDGTLCGVCYYGHLRLQQD